MAKYVKAAQMKNTAKDITLGAGLGIVADLLRLLLMVLQP
jgi:hypothetical protein